MNTHRVRAHVGMVLLACSLPVASLPVDSTSGNVENAHSEIKQTPPSLSLKYALQLTLQKNPQLKAYPYYVRQLDGEMIQANISPSPNAKIELSLDEATLTLSQNIELGDKRNTRVVFTHAKQERLQAEFEITRLDVLAETSRRYYQLLALQKQKILLSTRIGQEERALKIINTRAKAGSVTQADVITMALGLARSTNRLEQLDFEIILQSNALSAMWLGLDQTGVHNTGFKVLRGNLSQLPKLPDDKTLTDTITQGINQLPDYRYQIALSRLADSRVSLNQAKGQSDIHLGVGLRHNDASGDQSLVLTASMPLSFNNPNRGRIASAHAQQALSYEQLELKRQQLSIELARIQTRLKKEQQLAKRINDDLLPLASELLSTTQKAYRRGQYSVLQWIDAQNKVFNLEQDLINSQVRIFNQVLELERILGQSIVSTP
ncbi:MAG: cobalt-zinc-cadmium efflux system outer membrane protein [Oleispira sp.]|jgi:cobalt-zinc-cadmium efflux system outer membrane protein